MAFRSAGRLSARRTRRLFCSLACQGARGGISPITELRHFVCDASPFPTAFVCGWQVAASISFELLFPSFVGILSGS